MLNSFQHPFRRCTFAETLEWTLKRVQGDAVYGVTFSH
ncbi:hypothetical protein FHS49_000728 [Sphingobium boeckii]|uniref:Uncharacterized protein n=1 Tax=Sphingobium boeckii TaxID=1082345 RepID=A0A7W9ED41_9SPHN|nr:hypothetical protein [Sphingobium boeckii]